MTQGSVGGKHSYIGFQKARDFLLGKVKPL